MNGNPKMYDYSDDTGYVYLSIHRQIIKFNPLITDNPLVIDYINSYKPDRQNSTLLYELINDEIDSKNASYNNVPISFYVMFNSIIIDWIDIIHQMVFIDDAINTFYSEYYEVIENIILYDTPDVKESLIYRITNKGLSIFHIAGKLWLINKYKENLSNNTNNISLDKDLNYILNCYSRLEDCLGSDRKYCILYMTDFTGYTLKDYLQDFSNQLVNIGDTWQDVRNLK